MLYVQSTIISLQTFRIFWWEGTSRHSDNLMCSIDACIDAFIQRFSECFICKKASNKRVTGSISVNDFFCFQSTNLETPKIGWAICKSNQNIFTSLCYNNRSWSFMFKIGKTLSNGSNITILE